MSIQTRILDDFVMHVVVKGGVFDFIVKIFPKNLMVLCKSHQNWF